MALEGRQQDQALVSATSEAEISTRRRIRSQIIHSSPSPSFFNGGNADRIQDSQFIGRQYVFNVPPSITLGAPLDPRGPIQPNIQENRANIPMTSQRRTSLPGPARILGALARVIRRRPHQPEIVHPSSAPMERDVFRIYERHMKGRGFGDPLWTPGVNMRLPVPYRQTGVCIGDVGIITREGAFDYLFNICLPRDHPINSLVPDDFVPLYPPLDQQHDIIEVRGFSANGYLASNDINVDQTHSNGINFTTSAAEGAILTMPRGTYLQRLVNDKRFNDYIANNAEKWYKFAIGRRGVENGDLRLVLGCHKGPAWGMATFANSTQYTSSRAQSLRFKVFPSHYNPTTLFWESSVPVTEKVGPEERDNEGLLNDQSQELWNQCLFVQAHVITLAGDAWLSLSRQSGVRIDEQSQSSSEVRQQDASPGLASGSPPNTVSSSRNLESRGRQRAVIFRNLERPRSETVNRSQEINNLLLQQNKDVRVAITNENDWCRLLRQDEVDQVDSSELLARIQRRNNVFKTPNGLIHFELKDRNPDKPPILSTGRSEVNNLLRILKQGRATFQETLLGNLPDFQQLQHILRLAYIPKTTNGTEVQGLPPFLMENPKDLFVFDKLLESLQAKDDLALPPLQNASRPSGISPKSLLYQALNSTPLSCDSQRKYLKALGDIAWKRYLEFDLSTDLDETIWLYGKAVSLTPPFSVQSLVPTFGLCSALYRRFYIKGNLRDLVYLFRYVRQQDNVDFNDLINHLTDHNISLADEITTPKNSQLPDLKFRESNVQPPHGWDNTSTSSGNLPGSNSTVERDIDRFAQKFVERIFLSDQQDNSPANVEGFPLSTDQLNSRFHELHTLTKHWVEQTSPAFSVLWLYGPSAAGMVSHLVHQLPVGGTKSQIASSFAFSDKAAWNNEAYEVFPTIAVDLAYSIPGLSAHYRDVLAKEDSRKLMRAPLGIQFWKLIVEPIRRLPSAERTRTIIITGVDNCGYDMARNILTLVANAVTVFHLPLRFIITSNRDTRIQDVFNRPALSKISRQFFVGIQHSDKSPNNDPEVILRQGFQALYDRNPSLGASGGKQWPAEDVLDTLAKKSHGNAVYANTVVNFVSAGAEDSRAAKSSIELMLEPTLPTAQEAPLNAVFSELDSLFTRILSTHPDPNTLVHALGFILVLHDCAQPQTILQNIFRMSPESFASVMQVLQSLMLSPKVENDQNIHPWRVVKKNVPNKDERVKSPFLVLALLSLSTTMPTAFTIPLAFRDRVYDSFYDFLVNPERSGRFYIDIPYFHGQMTEAGFALVTHCMWRPSRPDLRRFPIFSPETLDYLKYHLQDHYAQCSEIVREQVLEQLQDSLKGALFLSRDKTEQGSDSTMNTDDFLNNVSVLINMIVNDWDSFGGWSHFADKDRYKDFRRAMDSIRDDLFPRRSSPRLRRLSGKFTRHDSHPHNQRDSAPPPSLSSVILKRAPTIHAGRAILLSSVI